MPTCKKCGSSFRIKIVVDGRERNLKSRRYCLSCSPFGKRGIEIRDKATTCRTCGKGMSRRGAICNTCISRKRRERIRRKIQEILGSTCVCCGYGSGEKSKVIVFHHVDPSQKRFPLGGGNLSNRSWNEIENEVRKCVAVCQNCHAEIHFGIRKL